MGWRVSDSNGGRNDGYEASVGARALWPWALFILALLVALVLFFIYPPR
jgi:hypothetical protein